MHTFGENSGSGVPAFLAKLWRLVEDEDTNNLIYWNADGTSFIIQNQAQFAREILPQNYKHNNMASFIRQLNMYGFHKITSLDGGGLKFDRDEMEFSHPCFRRDQPFLLEHIKRKISTAKTTNIDDKSTIKQEVVSKVLNDVKAMKGRQDSLDSRFVSMKQENEALWREVAILRQKHLKQQQIVNKLIQFLVTIVQPQRGSGIGSMGGMGGVKRRYQLMINDVPDASKIRKTGRTTSTSSGNDGPIIRELTEELLDNYNEADDDINSPYVVSPGLQQQSSGNDYEDIENVTDADQLIDEDVGETVSQTPLDDYTTYATDSIDTIAAAIGAEAGPSNTMNKTRYIINGIAEEVPAELIVDASQLLDAQTSQPTTQQTAPQQKQASTQYQQPPQTGKMGGTVAGKQPAVGRKIVVPANLVKQLPGATGSKHLPTVSQTKTSQPTATAATTSNLMRGTMGKSLLNAQKLKLAMAPQKQPAYTVQTTQPQSQSQSQLQQPIVTTTQAAPQKAQGFPTAQSTTSAPQMMRTFNKSFINAEMPKNLFDDNEPLDDSLLPVDLISDDASTIVDVDHMGNSYSASSSTGASAGGAAASTDAPACGSVAGQNMAVAKYNNDDLMTIPSPEQIHHHLDTVQGDLDSLKEFLRNEDYSLDANALLGNSSGPSNVNCLYLSPSIDGDTFSVALSKLFGDTDVFQQYGIPMNPTDSTTAATVPGISNKTANKTQNEVCGSELISYQPTQTPIDFTEFLNIDDDQPLMTRNDQNPAEPSTPSTPQNNNLFESDDLATPYIKRQSFAFPK